MKNLLRILSFALIVSLVAVLFASCSQPASETTSEATSEATSEVTSEDVTFEELPAEALPVRDKGLYDGEESVEPGVIMTVNGNEIDYDTYRYHYLTNRYMMDGGDTSVWNTDDVEIEQYKDTLLQISETSVISSFAIEAYAAANNIELTEEDLAKIDANMEQLAVNVGGEENLQPALEAQYLTEDIYRESIELNLLINAIIAEKYLDQITANFNENYVRAQHILIPFADMTAESHEEELAQAQEVLERIQGGEDFETVQADYIGNDPGQPAEGYYFTTGEMVEEFEEAAFALENEEVSEIVETVYGYHIIRRLPIADTYLSDIVANFMTENMVDGEYIANYMTLEMQDELALEFEAISQEFEIEYGEHYDLISPANVH